MNQCSETPDEDCVEDLEKNKCVTNTCKNTEDCKKILGIDNKSRFYYYCDSSHNKIIVRLSSTIRRVHKR